jgi:diguanylate cyclase
MAPPEPDDFSVALERSRSAMGLLQQYKIPPTPVRYIVAYLHASGENPDLAIAVNRLVSHNKVTAQALDEIHDQFFGRQIEETALRDASRRIERTVTEVVDYIDAVAEGAEHYGEVLADFSDKANGPSGTFESAVTEVLGETKHMAQSSRALEEKLQASSREIVTLRQHLEQLEKEVSTDALTGVANRKRFDVALREAFKAANKSTSQLSLIMIDIDHFKQFNDTYGHQLGDQVLRLVARYLTDCIKGNDLAARYGGEEFAVILPRTRLVDGLHVAEQIRAHVASKSVVNRRTGQALGQITLSLGVAEYQTGETPAELIHRADEALYLAKSKGRNRVVSESELPAAAG